MLVVHGLWAVDGPGSLVLWAEDGSRVPGEPAATLARTGRKKRSPAPKPRPCPHPFAASGADLTSVLAGPALRTHGATPAAGNGDEPVAGESLVWLPGSPNSPEASPQLVWTGERPQGRRVAPDRARGPWPFAVPSVRLAPGPAAALLLALVERTPEGVHLGTSVRALARTGDLALEAVAAGRVLPTLVLDDTGGAEARWVPLGHGEDAARLGQLAAALPPACRCLDGAPPASAVVAHAFRSFVDAACRAALTRSAVPGIRRPPLGTAPFTERWLAALAGPDARVPGDESELSAGGRLVTQWRGPADAAVGSWRLCFRLREPEPGAGGGDQEAAGGGDQEAAGGVWGIDLLLQAADDPSLLVDAAAVWRSGETLRRAARSLHAPHEVLLAELGRAVRVFPELSVALATPRPTVLETDVGGAHRFLSTVAPALEVAGFGVLLPSWWRRPGGRLGLRLRASTSSRSSGGGRLDPVGLATVDWQAALGDRTLSMAELRRLAALKAPLVRVRGQWMELRPDEVAQLAEFLARGPRRRRSMTLADVLRAASGSPVAGAGLPVVGVEAEGVLAAMLGGDLEAVLEVRETPRGFAGELRPYQRRAVAWIELLERSGLGACLADDMGLGKTATVLAVLQSERLEAAPGSTGRGGSGRGRRAAARTRPGPTLVVCPTSVVGNWQAEIERFTPSLVAVVHHGARRARGESVADLAAADVVITSYPLVERDLAALATVPWHRIVLDEAQQVKNPGAKQTRAVRSIAPPRRIALTGTPVENHLGDLWSLMEILNPGLLGSEQGFRERFAVPIERFGAADAAEALRTLTRPFVLRRLKTDKSIIADLPEKLEMTVRCSLTREQATLYQAVVDEMLQRIATAEGIERRGLVLSTMLRLKQVCNHPAQYLGDGSALPGRSGKLERTAEILDTVREAGEKALVFTQFAEMGSLLQGHLQERLGCRVSFLHGGVPRSRRDDMVAELQDPDGGVPVMVLSLKAGGSGLNLTAANHVVHFDRWWNPAVERQATDRAYRIGQRRDVQVRTLVCAGTVEDRIAEMIEAKRELAERVVGTGEAWLTELSTEDLAAVLRLSTDAVVAA